MPFSVQIDLIHGTTKEPQDRTMVTQDAQHLRARPAETVEALVRLHQAEALVQVLLREAKVQAALHVKGKRYEVDKNPFIGSWNDAVLPFCARSKRDRCAEVQFP